MELHSNGKGFTCEHCPKVFKSKKGLSDHVVFHTEKKYSCKTCGRGFSRNADMKRHMQLKHDIPYERVPRLEGTTCSICKREFETKRKLRHHLKSHNSREFQCEFCDKAFFSSGHLRAHQRRHTEVGEFSCDLCSKTFQLEITLKAHKKNVHMNNLKILCEICSASFKSKASYMLHKRSHTNDFVAKCEECGIGFTTNTKYKIHQIVKHGMEGHMCHICGKNFTKAAILRIHIGRHASEEEKKKAGIKCTDCDKMFVDVKLMKEHHEVVHEKRYAKSLFCNLCGKEFSYGTNLKQHMKSHERNQNQVFTCQYCGEIFTFKKTLKRHLATHPETRPYKCEECDKMFGELNTLKAHITKMHKK